MFLYQLWHLKERFPTSIHLTTIIHIYTNVHYLSFIIKTKLNNVTWHRHCFHSGRMVRKDGIPNGVCPENVEDVEGPSSQHRSRKSSRLKHSRQSTTETGKTAKEPSIWKVVFRAYGGYYALGGVYMMCFNLITLISPQILK